MKEKKSRKILVCIIRVILWFCCWYEDQQRHGTLIHILVLFIIVDWWSVWWIDSSLFKRDRLPFYSFWSYVTIYMCIHEDCIVLCTYVLWRRLLYYVSVNISRFFSNYIISLILITLLFTSYGITIIFLHFIITNKCQCVT